MHRVHLRKNPGTCSQPSDGGRQLTIWLRGRQDPSPVVPTSHIYVTHEEMADFSDGPGDDTDTEDIINGAEA